MKELEQLKSSYEYWLGEYTWNWYGTLKITNGMHSRKHAIKMFEEWITRLEESEGNSRFRWVRVIEKGSHGDNIHFHCLIGGFRNRKEYWGHQWENLGGHIHLAKFDPARGGIRYLLKTMKQNGELDMEFHLPTDGKQHGQ